MLCCWRGLIIIRRRRPSPLPFEKKADFNRLFTKPNSRFKPIGPKTFKRSIFHRVSEIYFSHTAAEKAVCRLRLHTDRRLSLPPPCVCVCVYPPSFFPYSLYGDTHTRLDDRGHSVLTRPSHTPRVVVYFFLTCPQQICKASLNDVLCT